jgi:hypothetical protein
MNQRRWVRNNKVSVAILIFVILFGVINMIKPAFMYNDDGSIKEFGVGFRKKTIIPVWLISIMLAIISYFSVMYYTAVRR